MDVVYQEASHPIAILETYLETQAEVDSFSSIVDFDYFPFQPSEIEVLEKVLDNLSADTWFTRAWTFQESTSAGASMMLLIGCGTHLNKPDVFGPTPGEIEISAWDFQNAMVNARLLIEEHLHAGTWFDECTAVQASNVADEIWNLFPTIYPSSPSMIRDVSHRQSCTAAEALRFLEERSNSYFPDRLSILANLCNYEYRLDPKVLELPQYAFTACVMTLAILNGDMSLLGGHQSEDIGYRGLNRVNARVIGDVFTSDESDSPSNSFGFSWGPNPMGCLKNIRYRDENGDILRLKSSTFSKEGLRVCGVLWRISHYIQVPKTQKLFWLRWNQEIEAQNSLAPIQNQTIAPKNRSVMSPSDGDETFKRPVAREFIWTLVNELLTLGYTELVKSIWDFVQPYGTDESGLRSKAIQSPFPFEHIFSSADHPEQVCKFDEQDVMKNLSVWGLAVDSTSQILKRPSLERVIMEQVCRTGTLISGRPMVSQSDHNPRVIFEACNESDLVFTPWTTLGNRASRSSYADQALSWKVTDAKRMASSCRILHCHGRRRGYWQVEDWMIADYVLE